MDSKKDTHPEQLYPVLDHISKNAHISSFSQYEQLYKESIEDSDKFWEKQAKENLSWFRPFNKVQHGGFDDGDIAWFLDGELNVSYNCLDRHLEKKGEQVAIIWEGEHDTDVKKITYNELFKDVCLLANVLKSLGVKKGDTVAIYLPNCPEAAVAMLACCRIGAVHSVIFAGFSSDALADRIKDASSRVVITADEAMRASKIIPLKSMVDESLTLCPNIVEKVIILKKTGGKIEFNEKTDLWYHEVMSQQRPYCAPVSMNSEDPLFLLYTSGSTGKPKGLLHTQAGYLLSTALTHKYVFDYHDGDVYACAADVGWITGHSYIVYGPLCNGATTFMFESVPTYPNAGRYWDMIERHKITQFYTAPTAIRALMKFGNDPVKKHDRSSLRILGTVGEPINPEAWKWYHDVVGEGKCAIVDTYWQTESGAHLLTPLPGATALKAGSATFPFFGIKFELLDQTTGELLKGNDVTGVGVISKPWPSISRTIFNDHERYLNTYMKVYKGYYFTGDGATRDKDGYLWMNGRVDDVINISGHRLGTAEIESALVSHKSCAEAAVIGVPHDVTGQAIFAYCVLKQGFQDSDEIRQQLKLEVRKRIGAFATPGVILITAALPKTRSGKIMRRLLRKIATKESSPEQLGDISTLADESVVAVLIDQVNKLK